LRDIFSSIKSEFSIATRAQFRPRSGADTKTLPSLGDISLLESPTFAYLFKVRSELEEKNPPNLGEPVKKISVWYWDEGSQLERMGVLLPPGLLPGNLSLVGDVKGLK
jgi:hypothetical protein